MLRLMKSLDLYSYTKRVALFSREMLYFVFYCLKAKKTDEKTPN